MDLPCRGVELSCLDDLPSAHSWMTANNPRRDWMGQSMGIFSLGIAMLRAATDVRAIVVVPFS